jgi:type IV secretion system protein VirD4
MGFITTVIRLLFVALKYVVKIAIFCGLIWFLVPLAFAIIYEQVTGDLMGLSTGFSNPAANVVSSILWYACYVLAPLTFLQNIIRMVKKDRHFSWTGLLKQKQQKGIEAKIDGDTIKLVSGGKIQGFVFGKQNGKYAVQPESTDGHVLIIGSPGCGKTAGIAIPTLMSWKERVFAIDVKGELYQKAGKARGTEHIKVFNPTDRNAYGYDPFYVLKTSDDVSSSARQLAMSIVPIPAETKDPFWPKEAQSLFTGLVLYYFQQNLNFSETVLEIKATPIAQQIIEIMADPETSKTIKAHLAEFSGMDDKTLSGVYAELSSHITVFATNDNLQRALSGSADCITPQDLENGYDIFCCIPEKQIDEWNDLLGMMCNQFLKFFEGRSENNKTPILFLIDEFPRLGKIESICNGLATLRSKKIHIALIVQSKSQLNKIYGKDTAAVIADNCSYKAILKANDPDMREWCSKLVGTYDKKKVSSSTTADNLGIGKGQGMSIGTEEKRIIKPEEFGSLQDVVCVFPNGYKRLQKASYYDDKTFTSKL